MAVCPRALFLTSGILADTESFQNLLWRDCYFLFSRKQHVLSA